MNARITLSVADCFRVLASRTTSKSPTAADAKDNRQAATAVSVPWGSLPLISSSVLVLRANSLITNRSFVRLLSSISSRTMFASTRLSVHYGRVVHAKQA